MSKYLTQCNKSYEIFNKNTGLSLLSQLFRIILNNFATF